MRLLPFRPQPWHLAAILVALCASVIAIMYEARSRGINTPSEMIACLPHRGATVAYIDVDALRRSGFLDLIAGSKATEDLEYTAFVDATGFDYRRDLDRMALSIAGNDVWLVLRGRFNWNKLNAYTTAHGGLCRNAVCMAQTSPERWVSYYPLRAGAMALAISAQQGAVFGITPHGANAELAQNPDQPVWVLVPAATLRAARSLPAGARSFVSPLGSAEWVVFSIGPAQNALRLSADVACSSEPAAAELLSQLERATAMLRSMLQREHQQPNPRDLSGVLADGSFRREGRRVLGAWPIPREFIESVAQGDLN
ncbi:MAG TPA: hypothetical protein VFA28_17235 [Bryobacteraceae bacterium]|jgi:hypothetical protein|nr:hypothetical protein [Bryobacteraceae bacterium]